MIIATAGHVDHGKSLLTKALTDIDPDRLAEEKERGLTIDLGFAYRQFQDVTLGFIDVPGHTKFIHNMLAGVSTIDYALLVIAADDGPMPQTFEHLSILSLLGIRKIAVVVTKIDRVSKEQVLDATGKIASMLSATPYSSAPLFKVSSISGEGLEELKTFLLQTAKSTKPKAIGGRFRLAIDRSFSIKGAGLVVTGSVFSGSVRTGDELKVLPQNLNVKVRELHRQDSSADSSIAGDRCALNISGVALKKDHIRRGNWLTDSSYTKTTDRIDARISLLASESKPLKRFTPVHLHTGANHEMAQIIPLEPIQLEPGQTGLVQIKLKSPINLWFGDRIIIRDQSASRTLGGGVTIDAYAPHRGVNRTIRLNRLGMLEKKDLAGYLESFDAGLNFSQLAGSLNLSADEESALLATLNPVVVKLSENTMIFSQGNWQKLGKKLVTSLIDWHKEHQQSKGINQDQLKLLAKISIPPDAYEKLVRELVHKKKILKTKNVLHLEGFAATLTPNETILWGRIEPLLKESFTRPPVIPNLADTLDMDPGLLDKKLGRFVELELLIKPVKNRVFLPEAISTLKELIERLALESDSLGFTAAEFRDISGTGRNLAIEILEYFDRQGLTLRNGGKRTLRNL